MLEDLTNDFGMVMEEDLANDLVSNGDGRLSLKQDLVCHGDRRRQCFGLLENSK